ncbi:MAG: hypothetical protein U9R38_00720 [Candidatus Margulisiibacteriota bacterium]|nr:hypothetical protein [Candidatus Margulisiibacteriota bacterium]
MKKFLFISNGHGEDLVAAEMIKKLEGRVEMSVLPVVGEGKAFNGLKVNILGPRKELPSGGFSLRNIKYLASDLFYGLLGNTVNQVKILRKYKGKFDQVIAVGDIVSMIGAKMVKSPFVFVGVNKSSYYKSFGHDYTPWEKFLLKDHALKVFVRDKFSEQRLRTHGIKIPQAVYVGNPLMDCIGNTVVRSAGKSNTVTIGFLPGTREDARLNLEDFKEIIEEIIKMNREEIEFKFLVATKEKNVPIYMENRPFAEVLAESDLIVGLSGTGNEQAAGSGIPIVSFYGRGSQYTKKFGEAQKQLLGESLSLVRNQDPIPVAAEVWELLHNPTRMKYMGKKGRERMGSPGAVKKISEFLLII